MPGEAATPISTFGSLSRATAAGGGDDAGPRVGALRRGFAESVEHQLRQRLNGLARIRAAGHDLDAITVSDLESHDADHAARVHLVAAAPQPDVGV